MAVKKVLKWQNLLSSLKLYNLEKTSDFLCQSNASYLLAVLSALSVRAFIKRSKVQV